MKLFNHQFSGRYFLTLTKLIIGEWKNKQNDPLLFASTPPNPHQTVQPASILWDRVLIEFSMLLMFHRFGKTHFESDWITVDIFLLCTFDSPSESWCFVFTEITQRWLRRNSKRWIETENECKINRKFGKLFAHVSCSYIKSFFGTKLSNVGSLRARTLWM